MRKLLHLFLAFILVSMTFAGGIKVNAEESDSIVGYWKLVEIAGEKNVMSREDLETYEQLGSVMYLKFRENGTVKFSLFGDEMEGWWNAYGITLEDSWLTYKIEGDVLTITNADGGDMICERTTGDEINALLGYQDGVLPAHLEEIRENESLDLLRELIRETNYGPWFEDLLANSGTDASSLSFQWGK